MRFPRYGAPPARAPPTGPTGGITAQGRFRQLVLGGIRPYPSDQSSTPRQPQARPVAAASDQSGHPSTKSRDEPGSRALDLVPVNSNGNTKAMGNGTGRSYGPSGAKVPTGPSGGNKSFLAAGTLGIRTVSGSAASNPRPGSTAAPTLSSNSTSRSAPTANGTENRSLQPAAPRQIESYQSRSSYSFVASSAAGPDSTYFTTPMQLVSQICQRRHFNPDWHETMTREGQYTCTVILGKNVVTTGKTYSTAPAAKMATAYTALRVIQSWKDLSKAEAEACESFRTKGRARLIPGTNNKRRSLGPSQIAAAGRRQDTPIKQEGVNNGTVAIRPSGGGGSSSRALIRPKEQAKLLELVNKTMDLGETVPDRSQDSPEVARAFLEGMAVGARLAQSARASAESSFSRSHGSVPRDRSRSPSRSAPDNYRSRSPVQSRIRLTPPPSYDHYPGRPHSDRYRPEDHYSPVKTEAGPRLAIEPAPRAHRETEMVDRSRQVTELVERAPQDFQPVYGATGQF